MKINSLLMIGATAFFLAACSLGGTTDDTLKNLKQEEVAIEAYLSSHSLTAYKDATGVRFTIDSLGSGFTPRIASTVTLDYTGYLLTTGVQFDKGTLTNKPIIGLIDGFKIGLPLMPNGTKATLYIPSAFAYGTQGSGTIPPNATLIFKVKLKSIVNTATEKTQLAGDTVKINTYLTAQTITTQRDTSGLRYEITQVGTGALPGWYNKVNIKYTGYLIDGNVKGAKFYTGSNEPGSTNDSRVVNYIRGFQIGLQKMKKGGKATLYIPSGMAFGTQSLNGLVPVPANSNVIYEIELVDIIDP